MFKKTTLCAFTLLFGAGVLLAHGNATHLMGTVTAVSKDTVTIQDKGGKSVVVMLEKDTKYLKNNKPAAAADLKVGTRVVIDARMDQKMKMYTAEEIQLGAGASASDPKAAPAKK
jgi:Domain of unknown function (DUF5666)